MSHTARESLSLAFWWSVKIRWLIHEVGFFGPFVAFLKASHYKLTLPAENEILSYFEMCQREGTSLQQGMNFGLHGGHSVVLMSVRPNAPYQDEVQEEGA